MYPEESSFHDARFERDLQELLETFVAYRPDIGFFDGLNYISAMLLQFQDEESAFTSTVNLFTQYLSNAVDPEMKDKFKEYCAAFGSAMDEEVPDVRSAFQDNKVDIAVILKDWIYSLFTRCVNFEDAKRLWDILLLEGSFGIVKIALGILKMFAGELCDLGVDALIGSHPHVIQPYECDSTHAVFYSLGNFVSNQRRRYCDGGLLAGVEVIKRVGAHGRTGACDDSLRRSVSMRYAVRAIPVWVALPDYRILPPEVGDTITLSPVGRAAYERFMADTEELLQKGI